MIYKERKVGTNEGVMVVIIGGGDVAIGVVTNKKTGVSSVTFEDIQPTTIGKNLLKKGQKLTDAKKLQLMIHATNLESLQVLEKAISILRKNLESKQIN